MLWQTPRLAQFIGLNPVAVEYAEAAEAVKAFMLWIFNTVDTELARRIQFGPGTKEVKNAAV